VNIDPDLLWAVKVFVLKVAAGSIVFVGLLAVWLGNVSAKRIETREQAKHSGELENLKSELTKSVQIEMTRLDNELAILREKTLGAHNLKIQLYQDVIRPLSEFMLQIEARTITSANLGQFNLARAVSYARLAMFAPQDVLDAYDALVDYLNGHLENRHGFEWTSIRQLIHDFLNAARADVGIGHGGIVYRGQR